MSSYVMLAREASELLAFGQVLKAPPQMTTGLDRLGEAWEWLTNSAATIGKYVPGPLRQILPPVANLAGNIKGARPIDILAGIGETAMDSPIGTVITGIGEGVATWDPEAVLREAWNKRDEYKDIRTSQGGTPGDGNGGGNGGNGGNGNGHEDGDGATKTTTETVDGMTTIYNYYYQYDPQDDQAVAQAANDPLMGNFMDIFILFMIMMPMLQGMGGLGQVIRAEPKQKDMSGWLY
jgi:hypothetical protein